MFPQIVSKCYIFYINFYIMFVLLFNIFILCQINIIIWVDRLGHVKCVKFKQIFEQCMIIIVTDRLQMEYLTNNPLSSTVVVIRETSCGYSITVGHKVNHMYKIKEGSFVETNCSFFLRLLSRRDTVLWRHKRKMTR